MKIEVKYFASIREATGLTHETVTLNAGASATPTVDSLRTVLAQCGVSQIRRDRETSSRVAFALIASSS